MPRARSWGYSEKTRSGASPRLVDFVDRTCYSTRVRRILKLHALGWLMLCACLPPSGTAVASGDECREEIAGSDDSHSPRERGSFRREGTLSIWNYFGRDFDSAGFVELRPSGGGGYFVGVRGVAHGSGKFVASAGSAAHQVESPWYAPNPANAEVRSGSTGPTLIDRNQFFSLLVMEQTGYIDEELRAAQAVTVPARLHPNQAIFFEATSEYTGEELIKKFGKIPDTARIEHVHEAVASYLGQFDDGGIKDDASVTYLLKEGTSWLISGQPNHVRGAIYLETPQLTTPISRDKFKFIWETGRAAQVNAQRFLDAGRMGVYFAARELILLDGNLDDAWMFAHALNSRIGRIYKRIYRMHPFSGYKDSPEEEAYVIGLEELMRIVDLRKADSTIAWILEASSNGMTPYEALKLSLFAQQSRTEYLTQGDARAAIQLRDFSRLSDFLVSAEVARHPSLDNERGRGIAATLAGRWPVPEHRDVAAQFAEKSQYPYRAAIDGVRIRRQNPHNQLFFDGLQELHEFLREQNAIEVTSRDDIDPEVMLAGAYWRVVDRLAEQGVSDPQEKMKELGIRFALYRQSSSSLGAQGSWRLHRPALYTLLPFNFHQVLRPEISLFAFAYSSEQVRTLARSHGRDPAAWRRGSVHREQYLSEPDLAWH